MICSYIFRKERLLVAIVVAIYAATWDTFKPKLKKNKTKTKTKTKNIFFPEKVSGNRTFLPQNT